MKPPGDLSKKVIERLKSKRNEAHPFCTTHLLNTGFKLKIPKKFMSTFNIYECLREFDDAKDIPPFEAFSHLSYFDMVLSAKYGEILVRNYDLPLITFNHLSGRYKMIQTYFKSGAEQNNMDFTRPKREQLYKTYTLDGKFVDIPFKIFYQAECNMAKIDLHIQGIESLQEMLPVYKCTLIFR